MPPSPLDINRLVEETFVARVERHAVLGSTNDRALQLAAERPEELPLLVVADRQTAGRGRGSNRWWTGEGNLAFSLLVDLASHGIDRRHGPMVALASGIATVEAIAPSLPGQALGLHWPNDVFAAGRKLAGILIEGTPRGLHVVGIGINTNGSVRDAPLELHATATSLVDLTGRPHDHTALLVRLLQRFEAALGELHAAPEAVAARADALCLQHGRTVVLDLSDRTVSGICAGVAPDGGLLLDTPSGRQRFYSGIVRPKQSAVPADAKR